MKPLPGRATSTLCLSPAVYTLADHARPSREVTGGLSRQAPSGDHGRAMLLIAFPYDGVIPSPAGLFHTRSLEAGRVGSPAVAVVDYCSPIIALPAHGQSISPLLDGAARLRVAAIGFRVTLDASFARYWRGGLA